MKGWNEKLRCSSQKQSRVFFQVHWQSKKEAIAVVHSHYTGFFFLIIMTVIITSNIEKSLRHLVMVAKLPDDNKLKMSLKN